MSQPYIGQIMLFGGNYAPRGWAFCNGQLQSIAAYTALYTLIGTTYGGDGQSTFALPDLRGRVPVNQGQGPGLNNVVLGEKAGVETVTLTVNQLPAHTHILQASTSVGNTDTPAAGTVLSAAGPASTTLTPYATGGTQAATSAASTSTAGNNGAHQNMQPYLGVNYIIALEGIFPSFN